MSIPTPHEPEPASGPLGPVVRRVKAESAPEGDGLKYHHTTDTGHRVYVDADGLVRKVLPPIRYVAF